MPKIYVNKAFKLQHKGETHDFPIGLHSVAPDVADHWFVKAHTGEQPAVEPDAKAVTDALLAEIEAKAKALDEQAEAKSAALMKIADDLVAREKAVEAREAALADREKAVAEREQAAEKAAAETAKSAKQSK